MKRLVLICISMCLLVAVGMSAYAQSGFNHRVELNEIDYLPPSPAIMVNANYAPLGNLCENAAPSYLAPGAIAYPVETVGAGEWSSQTILTELQFAAYAESVSSDYLQNGRTLHSEPNQYGGPGFAVQGVIIGDTWTCIPVDGGAAVYWHVEFGYESGWLLESLRWTDYVLNPAWIVGAEGNGIQADAPTLSDLTLYYWSPSGDPNLNVPLGGDTIMTEIPATTGPKCAFGAPSYIQQGDAVEVRLSGYTKYPNGLTSEEAYTQWDFSQSEAIEFVNGSQNLMWLVEEWQGRRMYGLDDEGVPDLWLPLTETNLPITTVGTVIDGPKCSLVGGEYLEPQELGVIGSDKIFTWWLVEFEVNGETIEGWYPESAVYHYYRNQPFNFADFYYLLRPVAAMHAPQLGRGIANPDIFPPACEGLPPTLGNGTFYARAVQNVRSMPADEVIGRVQPTQPLVLRSPSVCLNGFRWRLIDRGWVAESGVETGYFLTSTRPVDPTATTPSPSDPIDVIPDLPEEPRPDPITPTPEPTRCIPGAVCQ